MAINQCPIELGTFYVSAEFSSNLDSALAVAACLRARGLTCAFDWMNSAIIKKPYREFPENQLIADRMIQAAAYCQYLVFITGGNPHGGKMEYGAARLIAACNKNKKIILITGKDYRDSIFYTDGKQEQIITLASVEIFQDWVKQHIPLWETSTTP